MIELLKLCGFEAHKIELELPRVKKAFNKLGITSEDVERGKQRLTKYYDMELKGVRKIFSIFIRELVNLMLSRDEGKKKLIYPAVFQGCPEIPAAAVYASEDVNAAIPDALFQLVFGSIFGKLNPILEAAEKQWLKAGRIVAHCGMVKAKVGLFVLNLIPKPDLFVTMDILCDTGSKSGDLAHELFGVPTYSIGVVQDRGFDEFPDVKRDGDFLEKGLRRYAKKVEKVVGFEITDEMLWEVLRDKASYGRIAYQIQDLVEKSDPLPISATHEIIWALLGSFPLDRACMRAALDALGILYEELQERVNRGVGVVEK
ncbi:MAG: 2-hydroxyacyl-CoA dehydratase, partial [Desulfobacteraceae bacterium]|nr:2-hydroxyacyl-CoA dehydratase [Desulfobacteraceae bacterium]